MQAALARKIQRARAEGRTVASVVMSPAPTSSSNARRTSSRYVEGSSGARDLRGGFRGGSTGSTSGWRGPADGSGAFIPCDEDLARFADGGLEGLDAQRRTQIGFDERHQPNGGRVGLHGDACDGDLERLLGF